MVSTLPYAPWGVFETALRLAKSPLETLDYAKNRVGDNFILKSVWGPAYIIADPVVVEELATELSWNIVFKKAVTAESPDPLSSLLGESLVSSEGYFHSHYRHVVRDQFTRMRLSDYTSALNQSFEHHSERWKDEQSIEFTEKISDVTLEVINATGPLAIATATLAGGSPVLIVENPHQLEALDIGELEVGPLSTVVAQEGENLELLRVGSITLEDLRKVASAIELAK
jgi:hypothetical protein